LIDATLAGGPYTLEAAGKDEAEPLRRLIAALHREHARQQQGDKQDISNQRQPTGHGSGKVADIELRNFRVGIASLPAKYREPLVLQSIGYSLDDIAELLELNAAMVAARLGHARKQLQLRPYPDDAR
jgi:DNA-directed RNA polymerase specialized sigma24 family protein